MIFNKFLLVIGIIVFFFAIVATVATTNIMNMQNNNSSLEMETKYSLNSDIHESISNSQDSIVVDFMNAWSSSTRPWGIAINGSGYVYVSNSQSHNIRVFNTNGAYITQWGTLGSGNGQFNYPKGIAVNSTGHVYVVDERNHRIQIFTANGTYLQQWGSYGSGDGEFNFPEDIAINSTGHVYVVEKQSSRIQVFDAKGNYEFQFGSSGTETGQLFEPLGITLDDSGLVYVADTFGNQIEIYAENGNYINTWNLTANPNGIEYSSQGFLAVSLSNVVRLYDTTGNILTEWTSPIDTGFSGSFGIAFYLDYVYVVEEYNERIQIFQITFVVPEIQTIMVNPTNPDGTVPVVILVQIKSSIPIVNITLKYQINAQTWNYASFSKETTLNWWTHDLGTLVAGDQVRYQIIVYYGASGCINSPEFTFRIEIEGPFAGELGSATLLLIGIIAGSVLMHVSKKKFK